MELLPYCHPQSKNRQQWPPSQCRFACNICAACCLSSSSAGNPDRVESEIGSPVKEGGGFALAAGKKNTNGKDISLGCAENGELALLPAAGGCGNLHTL